MSGNLWGEIAGSAPREVRGLEALNSEGITKYAALTALLPNLAGFSIRSGAMQFNCSTKATETGVEGPPNGQHGDARREFVPRRASSAPRTGCPVSAASAAASPAATARRASSAGGTAAARTGRAAAPRSGTAAPGPPTALGAALGAPLLLHRDAAGGTAADRGTRRAAAPPSRRAPVAHARHQPDERDRHHDHDDRQSHTSHRPHRPSVPPWRSPPRSLARPHRFIASCFVLRALRAAVLRASCFVRFVHEPRA